MPYTKFTDITTSCKIWVQDSAIDVVSQTPEQATQNEATIILRNGQEWDVSLDGIEQYVTKLWKDNYVK
jgi:hypothetical protein